MARDALPCIVCDKPLRNVFIEAGNQPRDGVCVQTRGNYGSAVWDSFDGEFLEFNICDDCLVKAGEKGQVWAARTKRPIVNDDGDREWVDAPYRPVPWTKNLPSDIYNEEY